MRKISAILCCHNSINRIPDTLRNLAAQQIPSGITWEVVLVDNASTDGTAEIAQALWARLGGPAPLRIVAEPTPGLAYARRAGLQATDSPVVVFCDDDNWLAPDYLARAHAILAENPRVGAVGGQSTAVFEGGTAPEWFETRASAFAVGRQAATSGDVTARGYLWGAGLAVRAEVLRRQLNGGVCAVLVGRSGGRTMSGDDIELCNWLRLAGFTLYYDEHLHFRHFVPSTRQTHAYLLKLQEANYNTHPTVSAYRAYAAREDVLRAVKGLQVSALKAAIRNEAIILLRGWRVRKNIKLIRRS